MGLEPISNSLPSPEPNPPTLSGETFTCVVCRDSGWLHPLVDGKPLRSEVVRCECRRAITQETRRSYLMSVSKLPVKLQAKTFDNFRHDLERSGLNEAFVESVLMAGGELEVLVLTGPVDVGKSHLAAAICNRWIEQGKSARYVLVPALLDNLRRGYNTADTPGATRWESMSYDRQMDLLKQVELLVMDDLGTQATTAWASEKLMMIIDHRANHQLPMVVTSNCKMGEIPHDEYHRIASRLMREPGCKVVDIDATEYRNVRDA